MVSILAAAATVAAMPGAVAGAATPAQAPCTRPLALQQSYLCNPAMHRGLKTVQDTKYGFEAPVPRFVVSSHAAEPLKTVPGWVFARDKQPVADSADLFMWKGNANGQTDSVSILVCPATKTVCPQDPLSSLATRTATKLNGVPAVLLKQPNMQCAMKSTLHGAALEAQCGFEYQVIATRGTFAYVVIGQPYVGRVKPSPEFERVVAGWRWLKPAADAPSRAACISAARMATADDWWVLTRSGKVLSTVDGGHHWADVTPPGVTRASFVGWSVSASLGNTSWVVENTGGTGWQPTLRLLETHDGGRSWITRDLTPTVSGAPIGLSILSVRSGYLFLGTGVAMGSEGAVLYRTQDGGTDWTLIASTGSPGAPHAPVDSVPFFGDKTGVTFATRLTGWLTAVVNPEDFVWLYRTVDGGKTWRRQGIPMPAGFSPRQAEFWVQPPQMFGPSRGILPVSWDNVTPHGHAFADIYTTSDGGSTWQSGAPVPGSDPTVDFVNATNGWLLADGRLYTSRDGGQTWTSLPRSAEFGGGAGTALDFASARAGIAVVASPIDGCGSLLKSTDGGASWVHVGTV